jgi:hypothetical protein
MKKLSVKQLIEFRGKSDRAKKTFVERIKSNKIEPPADGGGDYWITSYSAVCNSYRQDNLDLIDQKIDELKEKLTGTKHTISKIMYQRNIVNLQKYKGMDIKKLRPSGKVSFLKKSSGNGLLTIKGLEVLAKPSHIFSFGKTNEEKVGAIWFTAKKDGYRIEQIGMFCEMLYRFLKHNYSNKYELTPRFCIAVDILSGHNVNYSQIENGALSPILLGTLDDINKYM